MKQTYRTAFKDTVRLAMIDASLAGFSLAEVSCQGIGRIIPTFFHTGEMGKERTVDWPEYLIAYPTKTEDYGRVRITKLLFSECEYRIKHRKTLSFNIDHNYFSGIRKLMTRHDITIEEIKHMILDRGLQGLPLMLETGNHRCRIATMAEVLCEWDGEATPLIVRQVTIKTALEAVEHNQHRGMLHGLGAPP